MLLSLNRRLDIYTRISAMIDEYVQKHAPAAPANKSGLFDKLDFNNSSTLLLGLRPACRERLFRKALVQILSVDKSILLNHQFRQVIQHEFVSNEQQIILDVTKSRHISLMPYLSGEKQTPMVKMIMDMFFLYRDDACNILWSENFASNAAQKYQVVGHDEREVIAKIVLDTFAQCFPSLTKDN